MTNPVYGYKIKSIRGLEDQTEVQMIDNEVYKQFLSTKNSKWEGVSDKELLEQFINEFCLQESKSKWRQKLLQMFTIERIYPKQVLLWEGQIPDKVFMLFEGDVEVYCKAGA